jgi:hypothetical protein
MKEPLCDAALRQACGQSVASDCLICMGHRQHQLRLAGCSDASVHHYCAFMEAVRAAGPVRLYLQDLPAGANIKIGVRPYSNDQSQRNTTAPSFITLALPAARASETLAPMPQGAALAAGPMPSIPGVMRVWGADEFVKVSPVTGNRLGYGWYNDSSHQDDSWKTGNRCGETKKIQPPIYV